MDKQGVGLRGAVIATLICAGCATGPESSPGEPNRPDVTGTWSGYLTTEDNLFWRLEDLSCFAGCPKAFRDHMAAMLSDPANQDTPTEEFSGVYNAFYLEHLTSLLTPEGLALLQDTQANDDLATYCEPYALVREATNPLPMIIAEDGDRLVITYEEWTQTRTIYMDGRDPPADLEPTPLGHSVGRYEDGALVVDTVGLTGDYYDFRIGAYGDGATVVERYEVFDDPRRLVLELAVTEPTTLREPYVWTKTWLSTPDVELVQDSCEDVPGQF